MNWKWFATLAAGFLESAGIAKTTEDENNTGVDDIIGEVLIFAAKVVRWALAGADPAKKPSVPDSFK